MRRRCDTSRRERALAGRPPEQLPLALLLPRARYRPRPLGQALPAPQPLRARLLRDHRPRRRPPRRQVSPAPARQLTPTAAAPTGWRCHVTDSRPRRAEIIRPVESRLVALRVHNRKQRRRRLPPVNGEARPAPCRSPAGPW